MAHLFKVVSLKEESFTNSYQISECGVGFGLGLLAVMCIVTSSLSPNHGVREVFWRIGFVFLFSVSMGVGFAKVCKHIIKGENKILSSKLSATTIPMNRNVVSQNSDELARTLIV